MNDFQQTYKVVHVGPSRERPGGIRTVMTEIVESSLQCRYDFSIIPTASSTNRINTFIRGYLKCKELFSSGSIDMIHIHMSENASCFRSALLIDLAVKHGVRIVLHSHGGMVKQFFSALNPTASKFLIKRFRQADCLVALTPGWKEYWSQWIPEKQIEVIPNFVDIPEKAENTIQSPLRILYLGDLFERKGLYDLIDAVALLGQNASALQIDLAGNGDTQDLAQYMESRGVSDLFTFHGWVAGDEKRTLLRENNVLVLPSHYESFGIVILEAFAHGLPVICSDAGHMKEVVDDLVDGFIFKTKDAGDLARSIQVCLNDSDAIKRMGLAGRAKAIETYAKPKVLAKFDILYSRLLSCQ